MWIISRPVTHFKKIYRLWRFTCTTLHFQPPKGQLAAAGGMVGCSYNRLMHLRLSLLWSHSSTLRLLMRKRNCRGDSGSRSQCSNSCSHSRSQHQRSNNQLKVKYPDSFIRDTLSPAGGTFFAKTHSRKMTTKHWSVYVLVRHILRRQMIRLSLWVCCGHVIYTVVCYFKVTQRRTFV